MFDESMHIRDGDELHLLTMLVRDASRLPLVFEWWMAELARDHLRLGVYFRAVAIMLQVPGAAAYGNVADRDFGETVASLVAHATGPELLDALTECLDRLGVKHLMQQIPGGADREPYVLDEDWRALLDRQAQVKHGLLNIVAECLDALIVRPGTEEIDQADEPHWWQRCRAER